jgi:hypothetical protein
MIVITSLTSAINALQSFWWQEFPICNRSIHFCAGGFMYAAHDRPAWHTVFSSVVVKFITTHYASLHATTSIIVLG